MYDAVGPETLSMSDLIKKFAELNQRKLRPVHVDYRNFERVLNVASLGNLNRQFVSLLRSEQDAENPIVGNPDAFEKLLGPDAKLCALSDLKHVTHRRQFPYFATLGWAMQNHGVIWPGILLGTEILVTYLFGQKYSTEDYWRYTRLTLKASFLACVVGGGAHFGRRTASAAHRNLTRDASTAIAAVASEQCCTPSIDLYSIERPSSRLLPGKPTTSRETRRCRPAALADF